MLTRKELNIALTANEAHVPRLHREVITVSQAMEREEYEQHMDAMESDEKWLNENDFRLTEDDLVNL